MSVQAVIAAAKDDVRLIGSELSWDYIALYNLYSDPTGLNDLGNRCLNLDLKYCVSSTLWWFG